MTLRPSINFDHPDEYSNREKTIEIGNHLIELLQHVGCTVDLYDTTRAWSYTRKNFGDELMPFYIADKFKQSNGKNLLIQHSEYIEAITYHPRRLKEPAEELQGRPSWLLCPESTHVFHFYANCRRPPQARSQDASSRDCLFSKPASKRQY